MPKRAAPTLPPRPSAALRIAALGLPPDAAVPRSLREDADTHAMRGSGIDADPQDFTEFAESEYLNLATPKKRTLVIIGVGWSLANVALSPVPPGVAEFSLADVGAYLAAFTGLAVRVVPEELPVVNWGGSDKLSQVGKGTSLPRFVGIKTSKSVVQVRVRKSPDGEYRMALNVSDVLDALLEELPSDAYSIIGLTPFDIHEDGAILGGRAYGGSRIACISTARYHPVFDDVSLDWPMGEKKQVGGPALAKARAAATALLGTAPSPTALWFSRVAATVAHEVGHCMGLDHCQYYACFMGENEGQPMYACPVCLRKMLWTAGVKGVEELDAAACARYEAVALFAREPPCKDVKHFAALDAWCSVRAMQIKADL